MINNLINLFLAIICVFLNGGTQVIYAKSKGYKIKPTGCAYFIGVIGNLLTGNVVPISAQSETITLGGMMNNIPERVMAFLIAAFAGIILSITGTITILVKIAGDTVICGMMAGVGLILCNVSVDMIKDDKRIGLISIIIAIITWIISKNLVYVIATSVLISTIDFSIVQRKRVALPNEENQEWRFWKKNYWKDFCIVIPKLTINSFLGGLSLICLNIGTNISFGTISSKMANVIPNFDIITFINSIADIPSVILGGMPIEVIISGTCSAPYPWIAGIIMMLLSAIMLLSGLILHIAKYVPAQSIAGFLLIIGFSSTMIPNLNAIVSSKTPLEGIVAVSITMITKNAFLGILAGICVKLTGSLMGVV